MIYEIDIEYFMACQEQTQQEQLVMQLFYKLTERSDLSTDKGLSDDLATV